MIKLSARLENICSRIGEGESVADVGTDHGFLPIALYERGISARIVLSDVKEGPLEKARGNLAGFLPEAACTVSGGKFGTVSGGGTYGGEPSGAHVAVPDDVYGGESGGKRCDVGSYAGVLELRLGSGLETLAYGEVDTVVIAGMGGLLIIKILEAEPEKTGSIKKFVLQPRNAGDKLRKWLVLNGFAIFRDELVMEGEHFCEVLTAVQGAGLIDTVAQTRGAGLTETATEALAAAQTRGAGSHGMGAGLTDTATEALTAAQVRNAGSLGKGAGLTDTSAEVQTAVQVRSADPCGKGAEVSVSIDENMGIDTLIQVVSVLHAHDMYFDMSAGLIAKKDRTLAKWLEKNIKKLDEIIENLQKAKNERDSRIKKAEEKRAVYECVLKTIS